MTMQIPDKVISHHPGISLEEIDSQIAWMRLPIPLEECVVPPGTRTCSSSNLWRGAIATFRLNSDGTFELIQLENPHFSPPFSQKFQCVFQGDFDLIFWQSRPAGRRRITLPFRDGKVIEDEAQWKIVELPKDSCSWMNR